MGVENKVGSLRWGGVRNRVLEPGICRGGAPASPWLDKAFEFGGLEGAVKLLL